MKNIVEFFIKNHTAAILMTLALIVGGIVTLVFNVRFEAAPDMSPEQIEITVEYSGATPEEVDQSIVLPIVEKLSEINGIKKYVTLAYDSNVRIAIDVEKGYDKKKLRDDVSSQVQKIKVFPKNSEKVVICEVDILIPAIKIAVFGDCQKSALKFWAKKIKDDLLKNDQISRINLEGNFEPRICVEVSKERLKQYNLNLPDVLRSLSENHSDRSVGGMRSNNFVFKLKNTTQSVHTIKEIPVISHKNNTFLTIGEISSVYVDYENRDGRSNKFNGNLSVNLIVYRTGNQNAIEISKVVGKYLEVIPKFLPNGIKVETFDNTSKELVDRLKMIYSGIAWSAFLILAIVGCFLSFKLALLLSLGMIACILGSIIFFPMFDLSVNLISLFSFMLVMGIVIDDSIVASENICRLSNRYVSLKKASVEGSIEIFKPVFCATLTTIAAFLPFYLMKGYYSKLMDNIYIVVIIILTVSIVEAFLVLPSHIAFAEIKIRPRKFTKFLSYFSKIYTNSVKKIIAYRYAAVVVGVSLFFSFWNLLSTDIFQSDPIDIHDTSKMEIKVETKPGISEKRTEKITNKIVEYADQVIERVSLETNAGVVKGNFFTNMHKDISKKNYSIYVTIELSKDIPILHEKLIFEWEKLVSEMSGLDTTRYNKEDEYSNNVKISIMMDDRLLLNNLVEHMKCELCSVEGIVDVEDSYVKDNNEIELSMSLVSKALGISSHDLMAQLRSTVLGVDNLRHFDGNDEVILRLCSPEGEMKSIENLVNYPVKIKSGAVVSAKDVAHLKLKSSDQYIQRQNGKAVVFCDAKLDEKTNRHKMAYFMESYIFPIFGEAYPDSSYDFAGRTKSEKESQKDFYVIVIVVLLAIYSIIAIVFNSFIQPILIILIIPFGLIGAVFGHKICGVEITSLSWFGISGMFGVAVNDSLVLIDCINKKRREIKKLSNAIVFSCKARIRPILLTTVTTFMGVLPLIIEGPSARTAFILPIAISISFGVVFSTMAILLLIPALYMMTNDMKIIIEKIKMKLSVNNEKKVIDAEV